MAATTDVRSLLDTVGALFRCARIGLAAGGQPAIKVCWLLCRIHHAKSTHDIVYRRDRSLLPDQVQQHHHIKWRPIPLRSPYPSGKVDRVQATTLDEFWAGIDSEANSRGFIDDGFDDWQDHFNWNRIHGALGKPPMAKLLDVWASCPTATMHFWPICLCRKPV